MLKVSRKLYLLRLRREIIYIFLEINIASLAKYEKPQSALAPQITKLDEHVDDTLQPIQHLLQQNFHGSVGNALLQVIG